MLHSPMHPMHSYTDIFNLYTRIGNIISIFIVQLSKLKNTKVH